MISKKVKMLILSESDVSTGKCKDPLSLRSFNIALRSRIERADIVILEYIGGSVVVKSRFFPVSTEGIFITNDRGIIIER